MLIYLLMLCINVLQWSGTTICHTKYCMKCKYFNTSFALTFTSKSTVFMSNSLKQPMMPECFITASHHVTCHSRCRITASRSSPFISCIYTGLQLLHFLRLLKPKLRYEPASPKKDTHPPHTPVILSPVMHTGITVKRTGRRR